ncbi:MAG: outer membrane lipoprotein-sorting protein [Acidobacteria bacterium]|nr:outer membrane lipoprotein-sorting protein [Acidobacteriota bacterium]
MQALRSISKLGQITYQGLRFIGDQTIKNDVIVRYLTAEKQSQDIQQMSLTPKNYKFKYRGKGEKNGHQIYVFQVAPKKKMVGLFKGELWVDADTFLPLRESGRFVKNPSVFLKKIEFVRDYEIKDGIAFPRHIESTVDTRFWGPAQMSISFTNVSRHDDDQVTAMPSTTQVTQ